MGRLDQENENGTSGAYEGAMRLCLPWDTPTSDCIDEEREILQCMECQEGQEVLKAPLGQRRC